MLYKNLKFDLITKFSTETFIDKPKLSHINIHLTNNNLLVNSKLLYSMIEHLTVLVGSKPAIVYSKKNNSAFNVRKGNPNGLIITLRKHKLIEFLPKLISTILPLNKNCIKVQYNNQKDYLVFNMGVEKLKLIPELSFLNNHNIKEGMHLEIVMKSRNTKYAKNIRIYMLETLLSSNLN